MSAAERRGVSDAGDRAAAIAASWDANADAWSAVVREGRIPSRVAATDAAIVAAAARYAPGTLLDVGCGEGWLTRALARRGFDVVGVDGSARLIDLAREAVGAAGAFHAVTYDELLADRTLLAGPIDVIVLNFALLAEDVVPLLRAVAARLTGGGTLLIQTVHPWSARGDLPYVDGWRLERFDAYGESFPSSMPWYFRTLGTWLATIEAAGLSIARLEEPLHPETGVPLSLLITCRR